jgi:hypothetical protein
MVQVSCPYSCCVYTASHAFLKEYYWQYLLTVQCALCPQHLKVHKNENFFGFDFEFCTISLLVMAKY